MMKRRARRLLVPMTTIDDINFKSDQEGEMDMLIVRQNKRARGERIVDNVNDTSPYRREAPKRVTYRSYYRPTIYRFTTDISYMRSHLKATSHMRPRHITNIRAHSILLYTHQHVPFTLINPSSIIFRTWRIYITICLLTSWSAMRCHHSSNRIQPSNSSNHHHHHI